MNPTDPVRWVGMVALTAVFLACSGGESERAPVQPPVQPPVAAPQQSTAPQTEVSSSQENGLPLSLLKIYPATVKATAAFNKQPDGQNALAVDAENATSTTVIVFDEQRLVTTFGSPKFLSALAPAALTGAPGTHEIRLVDGVRESNRVELVVK